MRHWCLSLCMSGVWSAGWSETSVSTQSVYHHPRKRLLSFSLILQWLSTNPHLFLQDICIVLMSLFIHKTHCVFLNETGALKENIHPWVPSHYVAGSKNVRQGWFEPETRTTNSVRWNTQFGTRKYMQWKKESLYKKRAKYSHSKPTRCTCFSNYLFL